MVQQTATAGKGLLQNRPFLALMASQLISNLGDWLHVLALLTMVGLKWNATPWQITTAMLCMLLPMLLGGPVAGMLADRMERKKLMILSDVARIFIVLGLVFVTQIWHVYVLLIAKSIFDVLFSPAKNGKIKEVVAPEHLEKAVSYSAIIEQGTKIVGPAIGGMLAVAFGIASCFIIDAASFLVSAIILFGVPGKRVIDAEFAEGEKDGSPAKSGFWSGMAAGMKIIAGIPMIAFGLLTLAMALLVLQLADSQTVVLFREIPGIPENLLGWSIALSGVGALMAAGISQLLRSFSPLAKMGTGGVMLGIVFVGAGFFAQHGPFNGFGYSLMLILFFVAGLGAGLTFIPFQVALQQRTPESLTGRVFGTVTSVTSAASVIGPILGGYLVTAIGPQFAFILSGGLMALFGVLLLIFKPMILKRDKSATAVQPAASA
ncbi:putative MFS family arabinose efflux permease [Fontibacillus phaseoli]|uniref:Putative MFS family arabinose efflux permease n=1 Tax=Fontibacillus phaseoli TaxID=1416533 RepID=A0A369B406_9BACL|nr:MFS transporter [Fontibacillus phaseoli]RCX16191.1 putative MFS family arabinose efflux permease [Fontibacillus phaseoli]